MNYDLYKLKGKAVSNVIKDYKPNGDTEGSLTIVDNSEHNILKLISQYGLYVDDIFIAGGYGFNSYEDIKNVKDLSDNFEDIYRNLAYAIQNIDNRNISLALNNSQESQMENVMDSTYNAYGFITSYKFLKLDYYSPENSKDVSYILTVNTQSNVNFIDKILVTPNNNGESIIEIDNINATNTQKYNVELELIQKNYQSNTSNYIDFNENIELILSSSKNIYSSKSIDDETKIYIEKNSESNSADFEFAKPDNKFEDDLIIQTKNGEEILYTYVFKDFLRWADKFTYYPQSTSTQNDSVNNYNFRTTGFEINSTSNQEAFNVFSEFINENTPNRYSIDYKKEMNLIFESNKPNYDFIILRNKYVNIEFYYNGFKSDNWYEEQINIGTKTYYIYQSPQKYVGRHIWTIKIN